MHPHTRGQTQTRQWMPLTHAGLGCVPNRSPQTPDHLTAAVPATSARPHMELRCCLSRGPHITCARRHKAKAHPAAAGEGSCTQPPACSCSNQGRPAIIRAHSRPPFAAPASAHLTSRAKPTAPPHLCAPARPAYNQQPCMRPCGHHGSAYVHTGDNQGMHSRQQECSTVRHALTKPCTHAIC